MTMTKAHAKKLLLKANARVDKFNHISRDLKEIQDAIYYRRADILSNYNHEFKINNEAAHTVWSALEDAIDNLYMAIDAINELEKIENAKFDRAEVFLSEDDF